MISDVAKAKTLEEGADAQEKDGVVETVEDVGNV
jgi:hypothetical protein